ncbi:MAG: hypothetical protein WCE61_13790 [Candidatus Acidiferrum sp.]
MCAQFLALATAMPQRVRPHEDLHGVLSRQRLTPPLRNAEVTLRYSPDGRTLMVQNPSGIYLLSREPLSLRTYIAAEEVYPARFSFDSQTISVIGYGLELNRVQVPGGLRLEQRELPFKAACLDTALSPGADFFACVLPDLKLVVYQLSTNEVIFSVSLENSDLPNGFVFIPLDADTAFPGPFGFRLANDFASLAGRGMKFLSMSLSPDAKILLVKRGSEVFSVDLGIRKKISVHGVLHKLLHGSFCLLDDDRVLIASGEKDAGPMLMSMKSGEVMASPSFKADRVRLSRNPRYALLSDDGVVGDRVFDLQENRELDVPDNLAMDLFGNEMAVLNERGDLFLYHIGEKLPFLSVDLPLDSLPILRAAAVSPSLDHFAFSVDGNGAIFQSATGERVYTSPRFSAATLSDQSSADLLLPWKVHSPPHVVHLNLLTGKSAAAWSVGKYRIYSDGAVLLEYDFESMMGRGIAFTAKNDIPFRLSALDPATGTELWKREFLHDGPVPFADPQGERLVLAWIANSPGAEAAAKRIPTVWRIYKEAKPTKLDTYFEVLDARSGHSLAGVLLQEGAGPYSFDAAFSAGDALFLLKDGRRTSVRSLQDGSLRAQLIGGIPSASARSNLFAIEEGLGRLVIYDLASGAKLGQHIFPNPISYTHFSADGKRLLVLTKYQVAYILDVSSLRRAPPPGSSPASHNP